MSVAYLPMGTIIELPDGRRGTLVYWNLDGGGIVFDELTNLDPSDLPEPDAMLRDPYPSAELPCVGEDFEVLS